VSILLSFWDLTPNRQLTDDRQTTDVVTETKGSHTLSTWS